MKRVKQPAHIKVRGKGYHKAQSLADMVKADPEAVIELALDVLHLAMTKAPESLDPLTADARGIRYATDAGTPVSVAHVMAGIQAAGRTNIDKTRRTLPHA